MGIWGSYKLSQKTTEWSMGIGLLKDVGSSSWHARNSANAAIVTVWSVSTELPFREWREMPAGT
jgi:hypothetical protein